MKIKQNIRKKIAFVLLAVFAFNAIPRAFLHEVFADHNHCIALEDGVTNTQLTPVSDVVDCDCDEQFTVNPFLTANNSLQFKQVTYNVVYTGHYVNILQRNNHFFLLRGPPVAA